MRMSGVGELSRKTFMGVTTDSINPTCNNTSGETKKPVIRPSGQKARAGPEPVQESFCQNV